MERILRLPAVLERYGKSRSTVYLEVERRLFPEGIDLGGRLVGWRESEVDAVIRARIAGKTEDEIRALVADLELARKAAA
jgi:prophage regulatory protein